MSLRKRRNTEFALITQDDAYTLKHEKRRADVVKSVHMAYANLLAGLLEDLPLGLIGLRFVQLSAQHPKLFEPISFLLLLSVFSSGLSVHARVHARTTLLSDDLFACSARCQAGRAAVAKGMV